MKDDLRAHPGQRPHRLREPHVVAIRQAETRDAGHIEDNAFAAGRHVDLVRRPRKHLAVARHHLTVGIDDRDRVVEVVTVHFEQ